MLTQLVFILIFIVFYFILSEGGGGGEGDQLVATRTAAGMEPRKQKKQLLGGPL